ncbi:uncharacterized protein METZ01_LOCUS124094 [marine metagenome]|uniref:Uncharacterized protein n=1 Tax=marine metagenome TaxID=408172 RepID=A0A381Y302_9ZZZZ
MIYQDWGKKINNNILRRGWSKE